ncbi:MAG: transporter substrate-binding domain-containing protein [Spirochaetales bacterium]|nr:transporter substrate-binding domain-containing protein [Spirochaetales bacterium]
MKKCIIPILLFLSFFLTAQEVITFDIGDWEPYTSSRDPDSQILEQLVTEIFVLYDMDVEYRYYPWLRSLCNVENGDSDGSFPLMQTAEREESCLSSQEPILIEENVFFHLKSLDFDWSDFSDLQKYRIGGTIGYAYMEPQIEYGLNIELVPREELNFNKLAAGHIDIYPASKDVGLYLLTYLFDQSAASRFTYHPKILKSQDYYLLISKKHPRAQEIVDKFDEGIRTLKHNGRYSEIMALLPHYP